MKLIDLNSETISLFEQVVKVDVHLYYFLQMDRILYPEDIQIQLIIDNGKVKGMIGDYANWDSIRFVGDPNAIKAILPDVDLNRTEIFFPRKMLQEFSKLIPVSESITEHIRYLHNKKRIPHLNKISNTVTRLTSDDTPAIQNIISHADPEVWSIYKPKFHRNFFWYGIEDEYAELISVVGGWIECDVAFFNIVATHSKHYRKGYAYTMLSQLISQLQQTSTNVMVETTRDLIGAQVLYKNLGFVPKYEYLVIHKAI